MAEKNIRLDIQYDGTDFSGWQVQPDVPTIQGELEGAIKNVTGQKVTLHAAGRTDAGVHAINQVANFKIDHNIPAEKYKDAINFYLPRTILIIKSAEVDIDFHARKSAKWRHYRYVIGLNKSALSYNYRWEYEYPLVLDRMSEIALNIVGSHDFSAFCVVSSQKEDNRCEVTLSEWKRLGNQLIYEIKANRFLHTMVRSLVGVMVDAGRETDYLTLDQFKDILSSCDHTRILRVAPARGLYLKEVGY